MRVEAISQFCLSDWKCSGPPPTYQIKLQRKALDIQKNTILSLLEKTLNHLGSNINEEA